MLIQFSHHYTLFVVCCAGRANERNEEDRLSSMITRWLNHDLECSWSKLATAVKGMRRKHAGPVVAKKLLQSIGLESGTYTL